LKATRAAATIQQRIDVVVSSFTLFLQEGYRFAPENPTPPSPLALEAIAATVFEIVYRHTRHSAIRRRRASGCCRMSRT